MAASRTAGLKFTLTSAVTEKGPNQTDSTETKIVIRNGDCTNTEPPLQPSDFNIYASY